MRRFWFCTASGFFILLLATGAIPGAADTLSQRYGDKLLHTLAYGFMSMLYFHAYQGKKLVRASATVITIALLGALFSPVGVFLAHQLPEALLMGLRLAEGVDVPALATRFGFAPDELVNPAKGLITP